MSVMGADGSAVDGASIFVDIRNGSASLYALDNNSSTRGSGD